MAEQFDAAVDQQRAEGVDDPVEPANQPHPGHNENPAHDQRPQDPPQQNLVLILGGHAEVAENQKKNEEIVHAERQFKNVTGDELRVAVCPCQK